MNNDDLIYFVTDDAARSKIAFKNLNNGDHAFYQVKWKPVRTIAPLNAVPSSQARGRRH